MDDTDLRGAALQCEECGVNLHPADVHNPHDEDCARAETGRCSCDHQVCPNCCWEPGCRS
jgi:hypothetical protein